MQIPDRVKFQVKFVVSATVVENPALRPLSHCYKHCRTDYKSIETSLRAAASAESLGSGALMIPFQQRLPRCFLLRRLAKETTRCRHNTLCIKPTKFLGKILLRNFNAECVY